MLAAALSIPKISFKSKIVLLYYTQKSKVRLRSIFVIEKVTGIKSMNRVIYYPILIYLFEMCYVLILTKNFCFINLYFNWPGVSIVNYPYVNWMDLLALPVYD